MVDNFNVNICIWEIDSSWIPLVQLEWNSDCAVHYLQVVKDKGGFEAQYLMSNIALCKQS